MYKQSQLLPLGYDAATETGNPFLNPGVGLGCQAVENVGMYIGKRNVEGGQRVSVINHDALRAVIGLEGEINDSWTYNVSYQYSQTTSSNVYLNDFFAPKIKTAVNSTLCEADSSCIPYQVFVYQGVTPEMASNLTGVAAMSGTVSQSVTGGYVTGVLPDSMALANDAPIVVFGFEIRDDKYERIADTVYSEGQLLGQGGATPSVAGSIEVKELYLKRVSRSCKTRMLAI